MKISELIKELEDVKKYVGDIEVVYTEDSYNDYFGIHSDDIKVVAGLNDCILLSLTGYLNIKRNGKILCSKKRRMNNMLTLEELLDNYRTYRDASEEAMKQLEQADAEIKELAEKNDVLLKRLIERDLEAIKMAKRIRELVKELAKYRGEDVK